MTAVVSLPEETEHKLLKESDRESEKERMLENPSDTVLIWLCSDWKKGPDVPIKPVCFMSCV